MLLGLDLGTTNIKALIVDLDGKVVAQGSKPVSLRHTDDGGIEQDIEEIWQATLQSIKSAAKQIDFARVRAVGISSQGGAIQVRDPSGRCIGPVISWMDNRGGPFDKQLQKNVGEEWLIAHLGHGLCAMANGQVLRLQQNDPALLKPPNVLGFVGDTIVQRLCGVAAHDHSSLSIASLYNPSLQQADHDLLEKLHLNAKQLPELLNARQPAGELKAEVAQETNLPAGIPVGPAVHDQYAAALGCGAIQTGDVMFGAGTAWVLLAVADHLPAPVTLSAWVCDHVVPQRWGQLLSLVVGGSAFKWTLDITGLADESGENIDNLIESVPPGSDGLRLWPFQDAIGGQNRPSAGRFYGIKLSHGRGHFLRATLEGLCFELARQLNWLESGGCPVTRLIMCGGAARSRSTTQIAADVAARPVICPQQSEISAFGAAILARAMLENNASLQELFRSMCGPAREIKPGPAASIYSSMVQEYIEAIEAAVSE
ncbi:MAG: hypothetical protein JSV03_17095 [Planctomycetota bacterium]|nr:MAG: hypothetical protein JSV03_17095 [Planctomycetota bacterium]